MRTNAVVIAADVINEWVDNYDEEYALTTVMDHKDLLEPRTIKEARSLPEWPMWEQAIEEEMKALENIRTWEIGHAPKGTNIVGSRWVFKVKKDAGGKPIHYKGRLVAQGFSQIPEVNFFETYAPVAKLSTV
ncbi:hypothetical protein ACEPAF_1105 [Sanghuangporus sanghuang]